MAAKVSVNGGRIRRVTITEIQDEKEFNWSDPGNVEENTNDIVIEKTTDEIFDELENVVQDWKKKLEFVVADGLKKIKRSSKEKKTMMKYLPGDGTLKGSRAILKAKGQIVADWKDEINKAIDATHKKLNDLGNEKMKETLKAAEYLTFEDEKIEPETKPEACLDLKPLMKELDILYQRYNESATGLTKVPIYNVQSVFNDIPKPRNIPFPWWKPVCTLAQMVDFPRKHAVTFSENEKDMTSLLLDFIADQKSRKSILQEWSKMEESKKKAKASYMKKDPKTGRRGRNSIQKMKDRKETKKSKQFVFKEIENKGEKHYYIIKKEIEEPSNMGDVEDIFADWNKNFAHIKRPRSIRPRVRKISHRAERKEMLKEANKCEEAIKGPLTYSQMLRKNLKIPADQPSVEDIFGSWMKCVEKMNRVHKDSNAPEDVEIFKSWNFIFGNDDIKTSPPSIAAFQCGKPTIPQVTQKVQTNIDFPKAPKKGNKSPATKSSKKQNIEKLSEKLLVEGYPLKKSEKVEKVLDMVEKKKEKVCKVIQSEKKEDVIEKKTEQMEMKEVKQEKKIEQSVVARNKMQVVPFDEKNSKKASMEELFKQMKTEMPKIGPVAKDFKPSEHSQRCLVNEVVAQNFIGPINKPEMLTQKETPQVESFIGPINKPEPTPRKESSKAQTFIGPINKPEPAPKKESSKTQTFIGPINKPELSMKKDTSKVQSFIGPVNKKELVTKKESPKTQNIIGPINKSEPSKNVTMKKEAPIPKPDWNSLKTENIDQSGRGEIKKYKTEEIFDEWRHIFVVANKPVFKPRKIEILMEQFFMDWLRNFEEPAIVIEQKQRHRSSKSVSEEKSPKPSKKAAKKELRIQDIEDDVIEIKDCRRQDFMRATMIRDKKRTEASRNSIGKRVK